MTSSTLTGDRRWASARRGGMTVLGKVAVPKPINLPSQRLENHGLDPNVEIVPKGTLSWGSRPSSSGSNPWGTSAPCTEGGSSSPSHVVGRPSSGGGTRPSTAGSEKAHDSNTSVWGPNSRPSSASGVMASNHTSLTTLRPCSAENKPSGSHLSRFAEAPPEGSGVWGPTSVSEKMGVANSAKEGFSLSTGDFPTLGSEKDESKKNMDSLDHPSHGRPGSSGDVKTISDYRGFTHPDDVSKNSDNRGNSLRKDGPPFINDGPRPSMERWHSEPHRYPNCNMAPHYESWCGGPPVNPQGGVWFRGPPGPYGAPVPPSGFPMEPFPFYHPQAPPPGLASSQQIPIGVGQHGPHPKNGDMPRRPHVPHMHPGMPMRPGFYPCPVPYDGYYRPPLGDLPFMGMPPGPPVYNRHPNQSSPDLNNTHLRSREGRGPGHVDPGHPNDSHSPYNVPMNPNDGWNHKEEEKWGHRLNPSTEKGILSKPPTQDNAWGDDYNKDEDIHHGNIPTKESHPINPSSLKFPEHLTKVNEANTSPVMESLPYPQDHSLIQKLEGLNAKARASVGRQEGFNVEESTDKESNGVNSDVVLERHPTGVLVPVSRNSDAPLLDKNQETGNASLMASPRRSVRGTQSRGDFYSKGKFHGQEADGWGRKIDSQPVPEFGSRSVTNDQVENHNHTIMSNVDSNDMQRAKMREIAKERAIQLQKEEEERVREQKAKALAKLEELNRRSANQSVENPNQKETIPPPSDDLKRPSVGDGQTTESNSTPFDNIVHIQDRNTNVTVYSGISSSQQEGETPSPNQLPVDANSDGAISGKTVPQVQEVSRQKRGYKQRQYVPPEKNSIQDSIPFGSVDFQKDVKFTSSTQVVDGVGKEESESIVGAELLANKKKVNKSVKNKNKVEESSQTVSSLRKDIIDGVTNDPNVHVNSIPDLKDATQSMEIQATQHRDDTQGKVSNSWKTQNARKPRNPQGNRASDKTHGSDAVMWAPVRSHNKIEVTDQTSQKSAEPLVFGAMGESSVPNSSKIKRAEMERYVPKPVAKELAQQGSISSIDPPQADKNGGREKGSQVLEVGNNVESKHMEGKNKHQRGQGSWRQRSYTESKGVNTSQNSSSGKNTQTSNGSQWTSMPDEHLEMGPQINVCDGWGDIVDDSSWNTSVAHTVVKDHNPSGRGKRHLPKGQKGGGSHHHHQNLDHKDSNAGLTDMQSSHFESNQSDMSSKESQPSGDHSASHWQPKSHKSRGGQNSVIEENKALRKESGLDESGAQFAGQGNPNLGHHDAKRGRRAPPIKETLSGDVEPSSGTRKNANYNGHFNRGHEPRGDRAHENKQNYPSSNRERQRQFSHYEYQPVGPYNGSVRSNEGVIQRERGQGHSRRGRGNSYRRQNGNE